MAECSKMSLIPTPINFQRGLKAFFNRTLETIILKSIKQERSQKPKYKKRRKGEKDIRFLG